MATCETCGGKGLVGGHTGQTPESYEEITEPCPDCPPPEGTRKTTMPHPDGRLNTEAIRKAHRYLQIYCQTEADNRTLGREPAQSIKRAEYAFALAMTTNPTEESAKRTIRAVQRSLNEALEMATEEEAAFIRTKAKILLLEHLIPE